MSMTAKERAEQVCDKWETPHIPRIESPRLDVLIAKAIADAEDAVREERDELGDKMREALLQFHSLPTLDGPDVIDWWCKYGIPVIDAIRRPPAESEVPK